MDCSQVKQKIPQWLDNEIDPAEAALIAAHVENCRECRDEKAFWQELGTTLQEDLGDIKAPPGFTEGVMSQLAGHQRTRLSRFIYGWKRNLAVAATFLLVAAGSVGAYMQMGGSFAGQVANVDDPMAGHISSQEPNSANNNQEPPEVLPFDANAPNDGTDSENEPAPGNQGDNTEEPVETETEQKPGGTGDNPPGTTQTGDAIATPINSEQYALLSTEQDRVIERTLVKVKVADINAAHKQALSFVNNSGAQYEVIGSESTPGGAQETLKVVVSSNQSNKLQGELKTLGEVVTTDTQRDDLNSRYNEKVEQFRSLQAQAQAAETEEELKQLQVKMAAIEAQLRTWNREADTDTIILWLEN